MLASAGLALLVIATTVYAINKTQSPESVFRRMVSNSLRTSGFTRVTEQKSEGQEVTQYEQVQLGAENKARAFADITQGAVRVQTETLASPNRDYVRYKKFETTQVGANGKPIDFSSVTGIWADAGQGSQFNRTVFGVVPIANVSSENRTDLMNQAFSSGLFKTNYDRAKRTTLNGKSVYVYDVEMQPRAYVAYLKSIASVMGIDAFKDVDPSQYAGQAPELVRLSIDIATGQLVQTEAMQTQQKETYTSYGVRISEEVPTKAIPAAELQAKVQQLFN